MWSSIAYPSEFRMLLKECHNVGVTPWLMMGWCSEAGKHLHVWVWKLVSWMSRNIVMRRTSKSRFIDTLNVPTWWTKWSWSHIKNNAAVTHAFLFCTKIFALLLCSFLSIRRVNRKKWQLKFYHTIRWKSGIYEKGDIIIHCLSPRYIPFIFQSNVPFSPFPWEETVRSYQHWGQFLVDILS